jgi:5-formyltetrahydrofolate cyclo-ligase
VGILIPKDSNPDEVGAVKARLRSQMREIRRAVPNQEQLSVQICGVVRSLEIWPQKPIKVMAYTAIAGEPDLADLIAWCATRGDEVMYPEESPNPSAVDLVILPGVAFSRAGARLGQGGGWYDRFLAKIREDCVMVGVAFAVQVIEDLPVEDHDIAVHHVVTQEGRVGPDPLR